MGYSRRPIVSEVIAPLKRLLLVVGLLTTGCVTTQTYKSVSAGYVGCRPDEIAIENENQGLGTVTWEAICKGERYICSGVSQTVSCTKLR
jgi:hypothetical protein